MLQERKRIERILLLVTEFSRLMGVCSSCVSYGRGETYAEKACRQKKLLNAFEVCENWHCLVPCDYFLCDMFTCEQHGDATILVCAPVLWLKCLRFMR